MIRNLFPQSNIPTTDTHARVRATQDQFVHDTEGGTHMVEDSDVILFGGEDIPAGSRILGATIHSDDMQSAGTTSIFILIGSQEDINNDVAEVRMIADGDASINVKMHGEYRLLPVVNATYPALGSTSVPPITKTSVVGVLVASSAAGWDIEGSTLIVTTFYMLD